MRRFKPLSALLAVLSVIGLSLALVVPAFAEYGNTTFNYPTPYPSYTGKSAGTNQTGVPYKSVSYYSNGGSLGSASSFITSSSSPAAYSNRFYFSLNPDYEDITFEFAFVEPVSFRSGYDYVVRLYLYNQTAYDSGNSVVTTDSLVQVDFCGLIVKSVTVPVRQVVPIEFTFMATDNFSVESLRLHIQGIDRTLRSINSSIGWFKVFETNPISAPIADVGDKLLIGGDLRGTSGVDDNLLGSAIAGEADAQAAIDHALGGIDVADQLEDAMHYELGSDFTGAFRSVNTLFSRLVQTFDISTVIVFLLVFGLAMYVVGRRTS